MLRTIVSEDFDLPELVKEVGERELFQKDSRTRAIFRFNFHKVLSLIAPTVLLVTIVYLVFFLSIHNSWSIEYVQSVFALLFSLQLIMGCKRLVLQFPLALMEKVKTLPMTLS